MNDAHPEGATPPSRAERFLQSFRLLEARVHLLAHVGSEVPFGAALKLACEHSPELRRYQGELRHFAALRNAIVHEPYVGGEPIADPRADTIMQLEDVVRAVLAPPSALSVLKDPVVVASPHMRLKDAAGLMLDANFSQLPVVDGGRVMDVLTSTAVARYLTQVVFADSTADDAVEVGAVVPYDQDREFALELGGATALTVVEDFEKREEGGHLLSAVCLVEEGSQGLLGIATVYDLPALINAARPSRPIRG